MILLLVSVIGRLWRLEFLKRLLSSSCWPADRVFNDTLIITNPRVVLKDNI